MSILFCAMLLKRNSLWRQSLHIAFFDLSYIALVCMIGKREGIRLLLRILGTGAADLMRRSSVAS